MTETSLHIITSVQNDVHRRNGEYMYILEAAYNGTIHTKEGSGFEVQTTRNRLALLALDDALASLKDGVALKIYTDAPGIRYPIEEGWIYRWASDCFRRCQFKDGKKYFLHLENADLWQRIYFRMDGHEISWADEPSSYTNYMQRELRDRKKRIQIEHYKQHT